MNGDKLIVMVMAAAWLACMNKENPGPNHNNRTWNDANDVCVTRLGGNGVKVETIAETCERAAKEIGAWKVLRFGPSERFPRGLITAEWMHEPSPDDGRLEETWWALLPEDRREKK